ncbi:Pre-mRNA-splicing factor RSE1 [Intoshia linei]|uniref:Pre-mRNA-splicing factor RSE1 n=1 Tax=Intoshia linei TaxID=1819745 RepID=A0A177B4M2_9BILA|nr:Pre-mRNA-splicing factor RSE1 [Intoshia linei]
MKLYNLTIQKATSINCACHGNFSGKKQQEIVVSHGNVLELLRPDPTLGKIYKLFSTDVFGVIRSLTSFRLTAGTKDYVIAGTDAGRIAVLQYNQKKGCFDQIHLETLGKSGCRRIVAGQYLAADPRGRAVMIGAIEKQKLVYVFNRDSDANLTISSPLEANRPYTVLMDCIGMDVGFENPMFACLEIDYEDADADATGETAKNTGMQITYYELDLGLNHVVRKFTEDLEEMANLLISVPGGNIGPSGIIVCSENYITYKNFGDQNDIRCPIPRRRNDLTDTDRSSIVVSACLHKTKSFFFFLVQTEQGDVFKIKLIFEEEIVVEMKIKYFDTVPIAQKMILLKTGFLFIASEFGNHHFYQITKLGDDNDEIEFSSSANLAQGDTFFYEARELKNLVLVDEVENIAPVISSFTGDLAMEDTSQFYCLSGRSSRSKLSVLRHGLEVTEMAVSDLPGNPNSVWTVKRNKEDEYDSYIVVSFSNATLILSIGETVEEVTDSGFLGTTPTLAVGQIGEDSIVQVYPKGIRHVRSDKRVNEWKAPGKTSITNCSLNQTQLIISLTGGTLVYFELDQSGQLNEFNERRELGANVICMSVGVPRNETRFKFLAVGLADKTVRIISLDLNDCLTPLSMQALPTFPETVLIVEMAFTEVTDDDATQWSISGLFLNIGLQNGVLLRTSIDSISGDLSDTRTKYLGTLPIKLFRIKMKTSDVVLAISSKSWFGYVYQNRFNLTPLSYSVLEYASGFSSEQCPEGIVAVAGDTLRIIAMEKLGNIFHNSSVNMEYTPRKLLHHQESGNLIIISTDHNCFTKITEKTKKGELASEILKEADESEQQLAEHMAKNLINESLPTEQFGRPRPGNGYWSSQILIYNPKPDSSKIIFKFDFDQNEAAHSMGLVRFSNKPDEPVLLVGVIYNLHLNPRIHSGGGIVAFKMVNNCTSLEMMHRTIVDELPATITSYHGLALISVGRYLRLYDLGKKQLLRKCENRLMKNFITAVRTIGNRIIIADIQNGLSYMRYEASSNQFILFADMCSPLWVTNFSILDHSTVCVADKFGNIAIVRLPDTVSEEDISANSRSFWDRSYSTGASQKAEIISVFHVGQTVTSLQRTSLFPGGAESIVYFTLSGAIGLLIPFSSKEDFEFFHHLELYLRQENKPILGHNHLSYRSYYFPVRNIIDGDLCETFTSIDFSKQKTISEELERTPNEVVKKLEDIRYRFGY